MFSVFENGCVFFLGNFLGKDYCFFLLRGFMDSGKVFMSVGIFIVVVDLFLFIIGENVLIFEEINFY